MRIYAPAQVDARSMYVVLGQVFDEAGGLRSNAYIFDFEESESIDESGFLMIDTLFIRLSLQRCSIKIAGGKKLPEKQRELIKTQTNSVPSGLLNEEVRTASDKCLHINRIGIEHASLWMHTIFNNWLAHELYSSALIVAPQTKYFLGLLENVKRHADVNTVSIIYCYDISQEEIKFVLADAGKGIPASIRVAWKGKISDEVAIAKAIEGGAISQSSTQQSISRQEGGLGHLIREIVDQRAGRVCITSGFGRLSCFPKYGGRVHLFEPANAYFPGTMVEVIFSTSSLKGMSTLNEPILETRFELK